MLYFSPEDEVPVLPDGCGWAVNETQTADGWLLYFAAQCGERTSHLDFAGGARSAEPTVDVSALSEDDSPGQRLAMIVSAPPEDPMSGIMGVLRDDLGRRASRCRKQEGS
jgi:hypothetical protein